MFYFKEVLSEHTCISAKIKSTKTVNFFFLIKDLYVFRAGQKFTESSALPTRKNTNENLTDLIDLSKLDPWVGGHAVGGYLPQQNTKRPHVWLRRKPVKKANLKLPAILNFTH
jgi:hypothetical protein